MSNELTELVRPGIRVDLRAEPESMSTTEKEELKYYITKVFDIDDDDNIEVLMPMEKTKLILLPAGSEFDATFYAKKGMYGCKVRVKERYKQNNIFILVLEMLTDLEKQQRREFFRFDCVIGMNTRQTTDEEAKSFSENKQFLLLPEPEGKSVIVDISGGGMRFISADKYTAGHLIHCKFILVYRDKPVKFEVMLQLLYTQPVANNPQNTEYRGQFFEIGNNERETIIKFIFDEQRKKRQLNSK